MKIEDLKILNSLFVEPNISKVAQKYNLSQSNLSKIIKKIETDIGFKLFDRQGFKGLKPTEQGVLFAKRVQRISQAWDTTVDLMRSYQDQFSDVKVTGPSLYMRKIFIPTWFDNEFNKKYKLSYIRSSMSQSSLFASATDMDILITNSPQDMEDWVPVPIFTEKFSIIGSVKNSAKDIEDINFQKKQWIGYNASDDLLKKFFVKNEISSDKIIAYLDDVDSILDVIKNNSQVLALLPTHACVNEISIKHWPLNSSQNQKLYLMYRVGDIKTAQLVGRLKKFLSPY